MPEASLKVRYAAKLLTNVSGLALGFATVAFVPRALGADEFGRIEFLAANFTALLAAIALNGPEAFFTWVSRHKLSGTEAGIGLSLTGAGLVCAVFGAVVAGAIATDLAPTLWPDSRTPLLLQAGLLAALTFLVQVLSYLADGQGLTVGLELARLGQSIARTLLILGLFAAGVLTASSYLLAQSAVLALLVGGLLVWLRSRGAVSAAAFRWRGRAEEVRAFARFVKEYARPLVVYALVGVGYVYADRWLLQTFAGSDDQGYFSLGMRFSALAFMFTSAMTPVLRREFARSHAQGDHARLGQLLERLKLFVFIAAGIGAFIAVEADAVTQVFGGREFVAARWPVAILALYPIHQTFGQLSNSLLLATGRTKAYGAVGIAGMLAGLPLTYLLLARATDAVPGLALGATGLALKTLGVQLIVTNVFLWLNTRFLGQAFGRWLWFQLVCVAVPAVLAAIARIATAKAPIGALLGAFPLTSALAGRPSFAALCALTGAGLVYLPMLAAAVIAAPRLIGLSRAELGHYAALVRRARSPFAR